MHENVITKIIREYLDEVYKDFRKNIDSIDQFCDLRTLTYKFGNTPDYNKPIVQQLYILKYYFAYLAEYRMIYESLLSYNFLDSDLKVFSFGAGAGIDYYGLHIANQQNNGGMIYYDGIDIIDWSYRYQYQYNNTDFDKVSFIQKDISNLPKLPRNDYNIIIFPKSIGEFDDVHIERIIKILENSKFTNKKLCFIASIMCQGVHNDYDRFNKIIQSIEKSNGFKCIGKEENDANLSKKAIVSIYPGFQYPNLIRNYLESLKDNCPIFIKNQSYCEDECYNLGKLTPILYFSYMNYVIKYLKKE